MNQPSYRRPLNSINITPLVDVLLILVAVLLLLVPRLIKPLPVELPHTSLSGVPVIRQAIQVVVRSDGSLWMQGTDVSIAQVKAQIAPDRTTVQIGAAKDTPYGVLAHLVDALRDAHPLEIDLLTQ